MKISAVIVTRGNVDLGPVIAPLVPMVDELIIRKGHNGVAERWEAILTAKHDVVITCDDDAIIDFPAFPARSLIVSDRIVCNMPEWKRPEYQDGTALVGWGAFVPKQLAHAAVLRYRVHFDADDLFLRECDRVVTGLSPLELVDVPFQNAPWANGPGRMCARAGDPEHARARREILERIRYVRAYDGAGVLH